MELHKPATQIPFQGSSTLGPRDRSGGGDARSLCLQVQSVIRPAWKLGADPVCRNSEPWTFAVVTMYEYTARLRSSAPILAFNLEKEWLI